MSEKYEFIDVQYADVPARGGRPAPAITCMCRWLGVSKSGFYEWRTRPESATAKRREELKLLIAKAFDDSDGTYGYRRLWWQLARWGVRAGPELVRALMRELGLVACQPRRGGPPPPSRARRGRSLIWLPVISARPFPERKWSEILRTYRRGRGGSFSLL